MSVMQKALARGRTAKDTCLGVIDIRDETARTLVAARGISLPPRSSIAHHMVAEFDLSRLDAKAFTPAPPEHEPDKWRIFVFTEGRRGWVTMYDADAN